MGTLWAAQTIVRGGSRTLSLFLIGLLIQLAGDNYRVIFYVMFIVSIIGGLLALTLKPPSAEESEEPDIEDAELE